MTRVPRPGPAARPHGPYETEADTRPVTRPVYEAFAADPSAGKMAPHNFLMLVRACEVAAVDLGSPTSYDRQILAWLAGWEPATCAVVAGLITRADAAGQAAALDPEQLRTALGALGMAADYKRDRVAGCPDCDADPVGLCGTCEHRLVVADEYDALAANLRGRL
jgi:hypothetical protein